MLIGLSGSIPLLVTLEQRSFYLVPSIPFFITGFTILVSGFIFSYYERIKINRTLFMTVNTIIVLIAIGLTVKNWGTIGRHKELLEDVYAAGKYVPAGSQLQASSDQYSNWSLYLYFKRYFDIDVLIKYDTSYSRNYFLKSKSDNGNYSAQYLEIPVKLNEYVLYQ
jgi:hypothetical protein